MSHPMMKCGHAANATSEGKPACAICVGINPGALEIATQPELAGRKSKCSYCKRERESSSDLPFFEHRPKDAFDRHYDGCRGWE